MKPIRFVYACVLLAGTLAFGQANDVRPRNLPIASGTGRPSKFLPAPTSRGSQRVPGIGPSRRQQTPQNAGLSFANVVTYSTGGFEADAISATDVNGDGKPDLIITNYCGSDSTCDTGSVAVLLNNGNGTFQTAVTYESNGYLAVGVAVADVNGDGKPDIVVANECATAPVSPANCSAQGSLAVLLGNGDGTFQTAVSYSSGGFYAAPVAIADVNGDGKPDLVVINTSGSTNNSDLTADSTVAVLLGNGDGTFQSAVTYDTGGIGSDGLAVADLRGDGKLDLVVSNYCGSATCNNSYTVEGSMSVFLGNGDGTFQAPSVYSTQTALTDAVAVGDVNSDGIPDIAVSDDCVGMVVEDCGAGGSIDVFLGNGDGTFQGPTLVGTTSSISTGNVVIADVNGDGKPDLEAAVVCALEPLDCAPGYAKEPGVSGAGVLLGDGDGTFQTAQYFGSTGLLLYGAADLAVADVDSDGRPDLVVTSYCTSTGCNVGPSQGIVGVLLNSTTFPNSNPSTTTVISLPNPSNVGQSVTFTVTVSPSGSSGIPTGTVNLLDGSTSLGLFPLNSSGVATAAFTTLLAGTNSIVATYNGGATLTPSTSAVLSQVVLGIAPSPGSLSFGNQNIGTTGAPQAVTLTNTGKILASISSIAITGANPGDFAQTNNCPGSLSSNSSCTVSVTFAPTAAGSLVANLSVIASLPGSPSMVALSGNGVTPPIGLSPLTVTFPAQYVGTSGLPQTVTLTDNGFYSLTVLSVTTSSKDFAPLNACGSTVYQTTSCSIGVFFDPTQGGSRTGTLTVTTSEGPATASLTGSGEDFSLDASSPSATVMPGQSATYRVNVSPIGGFHETVNLSCGGAPDQSTCSLSPNSVKLDGSTPASVTVTVTTAGSSGALAPPNFFPDERSAAMLSLALFGLSGTLLLCGSAGGRFKSRVRVLYLLGVLWVAYLGMSLGGCGGSSAGGTSANTYNLSVTGTFASGSTTLTNSAKLTLVVR